MKLLPVYGNLIESAVSGYDFPQSPANLYDPLRYFMQLGGKRIRPVLTLMGGALFGVPESESLPAALCIEFFHNFSLIHDDIMDQAPVRRGQPTVHTRWNEHIAILSGDVLFVEAYRQLSHYRDERLVLLLERFNQTAREVCDGQQLDMDFETQTDVSEADYIEMIRLKTSVLLGCALEFGAIIARSDEKTRALLYDFGVQLGIAFQIQDDLLDLYADPEKFGKQVGGDILSNKKTLLLLTAMHKAERMQDKRVATLISMPPTAEKVTFARQLFSELGIVEDVRGAMEKHYRKALDDLNEIALPEDRKQPLRELAAFLMNREQ